MKYKEHKHSSDRNSRLAELIELIAASNAPTIADGHIYEICALTKMNFVDLLGWKEDRKIAAIDAYVRNTIYQKECLKIDFNSNTKELSPIKGGGLKLHELSKVVNAAWLKEYGSRFTTTQTIDVFAKSVGFFDPNKNHRLIPKTMRVFDQNVTIAIEQWQDASSLEQSLKSAQEIIALGKQDLVKGGILLFNGGKVILEKDLEQEAKQELIEWFSGLPTLDMWKQGSSRSFIHRRGPTLRTVDKALKDLDDIREKLNAMTLEDLTKWKTSISGTITKYKEKKEEDSKGDWRNHGRFKTSRAQEVMLKLLNAVPPLPASVKGETIKEAINGIQIVRKGSLSWVLCSYGTEKFSGNIEIVNAIKQFKKLPKVNLTLDLNDAKRIASGTKTVVKGVTHELVMSLPPTALAKVLVIGVKLYFSKRNIQAFRKELEIQKVGVSINEQKYYQTLTTVADIWEKDKVKGATKELCNLAGSLGGPAGKAISFGLCGLVELGLQFSILINDAKKITQILEDLETINKSTEIEEILKALSNSEFLTSHVTRMLGQDMLINSKNLAIQEVIQKENSSKPLSSGYNDFVETALDATQNLLERSPLRAAYEEVTVAYPLKSALLESGFLSKIKSPFTLKHELEQQRNISRRK